MFGRIIMKKYTLLLAACAAFLYSSAAWSRICFLADTNCQTGEFGAEVKVKSCKGKGYVFGTDRCEGVIYTDRCNDSSGNWYSEDGCEPGYTDMDLKANSDIYTCEGGASCGRCCPNDKIRCKPKFKVCQSPTFPSTDNDNEHCKEPVEDAVDKFTLCDCDTSDYIYNKTFCGGYGLKLSGAECHGDNGSWYKECTCATGFQQTTKMECPDSCTQGCKSWDSIALPGTNSYCWNGAECNPEPEPEPEPEPIEQCTDSKKANFDQFWCGYDVASTNKNITKDCTTLGYRTGTAETGIKCRDNTEPYRCIFNHEVVYCRAGLCEYPKEADCKSANSKSVCEKNANDICFMPTKCKDGYHKPCNGGTLTGADEFGCGTCTCPENMIIVDGNCVSAYETCSDAGYSDVSDSCKGTTTILLKNGSNKTCCSGGFCSGKSKLNCSTGYFVKACTSYNDTEYGTCHTVYADCEAADYYDTEDDCVGNGGHICTTRNIYTSTSGTLTTCYQRSLLCKTGYAKDESDCTQTSSGTTCDNGYRLAIKLNTDDSTCLACQCKLEFEPSDPTPSYDCDAKYSTLNTQAQSAAKSYRACCDTGNITYCNRRSKGNCTTWPGAYNDGCIPLAKMEASDQLVGEDYSENQCEAALQAIKDDVATHNANCPDKQITDNISINQCNSYIQNGNLAYCTVDGCTCGSSNNGLL